MYFTDRATIKNGRASITPEGYFVADALVGRANNIQEYRAGELGETFADRDPNSTVRIFRPEAEVFAVDSLKTASRLPITLNHPPGVMVDAGNWREYVHGESGEQVMRDGEFIRVPIRVNDAQAVSAMNSTHKEFSLGYAANVRVEAGTFGDQAYDAVLTDIRYNHLAACRAARGGPELRVTDERPMKGNPMLVLIDGLQVDVSNPEVAGATVQRLVAARDTATGALDALQAKVGEHANTIAARDAEIVTLKDAADKAKPTPAGLRDAAAQYARTTASAKALGAVVTDEMDVPALQRAAVSHKMGDAAANYTDEQVQSAFDVLAATVTDAAPDPLRAVVMDGAPVSVGDAQAAADKAKQDRLDRLAGKKKMPA